MALLKFVSHSKKAIKIACEHGWLPGARYTNLRDVKEFEQLGFLDIDWKNYNFEMHLNTAKEKKPLLTVAKDIESKNELDEIIEQAELLSRYAKTVVVVPKDNKIADVMEDLIPSKFIFGYSVPTKYGGTKIPPKRFKRPVHLLGGRPEVQRRLADKMDVISFDCNRFTLDAIYGDYFDGEIFRPHPIGGYYKCLEDSIININRIWKSYEMIN